MEYARQSEIEYYTRKYKEDYCMDLEAAGIPVDVDNPKYIYYLKAACDHVVITMNDVITDLLSRVKNVGSNLDKMRLSADVGTFCTHYHLTNDRYVDVGKLADEYPNGKALMADLNKLEDL